MKFIFFLAMLAGSVILGAHLERIYGISALWSPGSASSMDAVLPHATSISTDGATSSIPTSASKEEVRVPIPTERLTDSQKSMLRSFGIDPEAITVTQATVACAQAALGAERFTEVQKGATPTFSEGLQLLACYRK